MLRKYFLKTVSLKTIKKTILFFFFFFQFQNSYSQDLTIPSIWGTSAYTSGTGDGASLTTYNSILRLHSGLAIGSPYVSNGNGGYLDRATLVFNGRTGDINSIGSITSNAISSSTISSTSITAISQLYFPTFNNNCTNYFVKGTGDGASLTTYNTFLRLHSGLAIGSPYVSDGTGGFIEKATIVFNGITGDITSQGLITSKKIHSSEVVVDLNIPGPDYVFEDNYELRDIEDLEEYLCANKHLPEIQSANEMRTNGVNVVDLEIKLLQKIEELTLYAIEQNKKMEEQSRQLQLQNEKMLAFEEKIKKIESNQK
jgi:hypothetical protein